jgi:hypothetical protein
LAIWPRIASGSNSLFMAQYYTTLHTLQQKI